jgi:3'(2'), 5'-bisphosphate nucleotidase
MVAGGAHTWQVMDGGDTASQRFIADELGRLRPDDPVLSEEGLEDPRRFTMDRAWIIDPLDGTREYGEPGRSDWAVHIAL